MDNSSKIAVIIPYKTYPASTGGEKFNALTYQYLGDLLPVTIISTDNNMPPKDLKPDFLPILGHSKLRYINPLLFFRVRHAIIKNKTSHLILIHPYFGWLAALLKWTCRIKLIIQSHNIESLRFKSVGKWWWRILWSYEKITHQLADINFFITEEDRSYAINNYKLSLAKCHILTYGIEQTKIPSEDEIEKSKLRLRTIYNIPADEKILFFNGTLDYKPNLDAVDYILKYINPGLILQNDFKYKIIICGKGLPAEYDELKQFREQNIIYAGFVEDIGLYFKGSDIFINPVMDGGGIKTKLVEAIGYDLPAVSTKTGAYGLSPNVVSHKLVIVADSDWNGFVKAILATDTKENTPSAFFNHFYWGNIARNTAAIIDQNLLNR